MARNSPQAAKQISLSRERARTALLKFSAHLQSLSMKSLEYPKSGTTQSSIFAGQRLKATIAFISTSRCCITGTVLTWESLRTHKRQLCQAWGLSKTPSNFLSLLTLLTSLTVKNNGMGVTAKAPELANKTRPL